MKAETVRISLIYGCLLVLVLGISIAKFDCDGGYTPRESHARTFIDESIALPLLAFRIHNQRYPTSTEGLGALVHKPEGMESWRGPYIQKDIQMPIVDPWKRPYVYRCPGLFHSDGYDLISLGQDGEESSDDIVNKDCPERWPR